QGDQRPGKNVGDDDVSLFLGQVLGQVDREARRVDAVTGGVVARGFYGLRIDVRADCVLCAQKQGGNGQDARATTEVEHRTTLQCLTVQPLQAQCSGRMGAGAKGQSRIEQQVDG